MSNSRSGFTLVELLVVIVIIIFLFALLIPAIQTRHAPGRRATCMNNQSNIAKALMNYESAKGRYPGWRQVVGYKADGEVVVGTWVVEILPYLEMKPLHDRWKDPNVDEKPHPYIPLLICPNDSRDKAKPQLNHVVNCGLGRLDITDANENYRVENGVFFDHLYENPIADEDLPDGYQKQGDVAWTMMEMSNEYLVTADGASNTILLAENAQGGYWTYPAEGEAAKTPRILGNVQQQIGFNWDCLDSRGTDDDAWGSSDPADVRPLRPNAGLKDKSIKDRVSFKYARPSSHHPGVFIASFCDGRTTTVSETISPRVYQHIMTPNSRNARGRDGDASMPDCASTSHLFNPADLR